MCRVRTTFSTLITFSSAWPLFSKEIAEDKQPNQGMKSSHNTVGFLNLQFGMLEHGRQWRLPPRRLPPWPNRARLFFFWLGWQLFPFLRQNEKRRAFLVDAVWHELWKWDGTGNEWPLQKTKREARLLSTCGACKQTATVGNNDKVRLRSLHNVFVLGQPTSRRVWTKIQWNRGLCCLHPLRNTSNMSGSRMLAQSAGPYLSSWQFDPTPSTKMHNGHDCARRTSEMVLSTQQVLQNLKHFDSVETYSVQNSASRERSWFISHRISLISTRQSSRVTSVSSPFSVSKTCLSHVSVSFFVLESFPRVLSRSASQQWKRHIDMCCVSFCVCVCGIRRADGARAQWPQTKIRTKTVILATHLRPIETQAKPCHNWGQIQLLPTLLGLGQSTKTPNVTWANSVGPFFRPFFFRGGGRRVSGWGPKGGGTTGEGPTFRPLFSSLAPFFFFVSLWGGLVVEFWPLAWTTHFWASEVIQWNPGSFQAAEREKFKKGREREKKTNNLGGLGEGVSRGGWFRGVVLGGRVQGREGPRRGGSGFKWNIGLNNFGLKGFGPEFSKFCLQVAFGLGWASRLWPTLARPTLANSYFGQFYLANPTLASSTLAKICQVLLWPVLLWPIHFDQRFLSCLFFPVLPLPFFFFFFFFFLFFFFLLLFVLSLQTLFPKTPNPKPQTLNPKPKTLKPQKPCYPKPENPEP